jgi:PQQ-dependent dehydrogenase (s-GDH family)
VALASSSCFKDPPTSSVPSETPVEISSRVLTENLQFPWEITWGPDNQIWMTEKFGKISRVDPANGNVKLLLQISEVDSRGEGGLLGMALHPQFNTNPYVYVAYDYNKGGTYTGKIVRYTYSNETLVAPSVILDDLAASSIHNGCRLVISADNKLFITAGDASNQSLPQNISSRNGKVLRVNLDGTIPNDNPDPASAVWSWGHRNPQGLVFVKDSLFSSEHGPDTDDEVNIIHKASNYGWPDVKGMCDAGEQSFCDAHHVVEPLIKWTPTIAVCGLDYYNKDLIVQWKNSLLMCTLKGSRLVQLKLNDSNTEIVSTQDHFADQYGRLRDICISPEGKIYLCTSNGTNDKIIEVGRKS